MHCYEIIPSWKAWLCFNPWLGGDRHFSTVGSDVTDGGQGCAPPPPGKINAKNGPLLVISWTAEYESAFTSLGKCVGLDVLNTEILQCLAYQQSSNESKIEVVATACSTQYIILNVHTVCDVIIARSCGTLPHLRPLYFCLLWSVWCSCEYVCLKTVFYFNLRLDRDLEIRIQRKLGSDTITSFLALQSQFNKAVWNSPLKLNQRC